MDITTAVMMARLSGQTAGKMNNHHTYYSLTTFDHTGKAVDTFRAANKDYEDYLRLFVREFESKLPHYDFHDALIGLIRKGEARFRDDEVSEFYEVKLWRE